MCPVDSASEHRGLIVPRIEMYFSSHESFSKTIREKPIHDIDCMSPNNTEEASREILEKSLQFRSMNNILEVVRTAAYLLSKHFDAASSSFFVFLSTNAWIKSSFAFAKVLLFCHEISNTVSFLLSLMRLEMPIVFPLFKEDSPI